MGYEWDRLWFLIFVVLFTHLSVRMEHHNFVARFVFVMDNFFRINFLIWFRVCFSVFICLFVQKKVCVTGWSFKIYRCICCVDVFLSQFYWIFYFIIMKYQFSIWKWAKSIKFQSKAILWNRRTITNFNISRMKLRFLWNILNWVLSSNLNK